MQQCERLRDGNALDEPGLHELRNAFPVAAACLAELRRRLGVDASLLTLIAIDRWLTQQEDLVAGLKPLRLSLLVDQTVEGLRLPLRVAGRVRGLEVRATVSPPYQVETQLMDRQSALWQDGAEAVIALFDFEKTLAARHTGPAASEQQAWRERLLGRLDLLAELSRKRCARAFVADFVAVHGPLSPAYAHLPAFSREPFLQWANGLLTEACRERGLEVLPLSSVVALHGQEHCIGIKPYLSTDSVFTPTGFNVLANLMARQLAANFTRRKKVLVVDLDNTLWGGVLGEDGPDGIAYRPDSYRGRVFHAAHQWLKALSDRGVLLAIASKNNESEVLSLLARADFPLKISDFAAYRINWVPKPDNLVTLAEELNLGLDSFVFLDDSPAECALMRESLPQVTVVQVPPTLSEYPAVLASLEGFDRPRLTDADHARKADYERARQRRTLQQSAVNFDTFLEQLRVVLDLMPVSAASLDRVVQLFERTNQFNLSTRRCRREDLEPDVGAADRLLSVSYADRFGSSGLVGAVRFWVDGEVVHIQDFVLSCRVLGRRVEHAIAAALAQRWRAQGVRLVRFGYVASDRNAPVRDFLGSLGTRLEAGVPVDRLAACPAIVVQWSQDAQPAVTGAST